MIDRVRLLLDDLLVITVKLCRLIASKVIKIFMFFNFLKFRQAIK
jgi:hypothetical protein